jgi:hypothetical protein
MSAWWQFPRSIIVMTTPISAAPVGADADVY